MELNLQIHFPLQRLKQPEWPPESFPVLLSSPLIAEECNGGTHNGEFFNEGAGATQTNDENEEIELVPTPETDELSSENSYSSYLPVQEKADCDGKKTYINYAPIVRENPDGNKEIYLTERDINNDASIIQLFNTDGSVITIDKSILSSLDLPKTSADEVENSSEKKYKEYFSTVTAHKCKVCSFLCDTDQEIKNHLDEQHAEIFLQQNSTTKQNGSTSILKNNEISIFLCSICKLASSDKDELKEHMIQEHKLTMSNVEMKLIEKKGKVSVGSGEKKSLRSIFTFLIKQQEKARKKIKCSVKGCCLRFAKDELRQRHEQCHQGENKKQFKCIQCNEKLSTWRMCSNHLWKCHKIDMGLLTLKKHVQSVHENFKPFICNICGHKTARKAMLELHLRQHTGEKPHQCVYCDYRTGDHNCLRRHLMRHTDSASYKSHIINRHPGKSGTYSCSYCSYLCINMANYMAHVKIHEAALQSSGTNTDAQQEKVTDNHLREADVEDDETQNCFLNTDQVTEETVDRGGITIPAGLEMALVPS
ncbi:hypothetical protein NQ317_014016 [Molorchus minor]|uniref:C2H2-type domain-containing protein n=1 Tax=Molorchus minor TaxID=1323400 RepID=A0ABQ9IVC9_9CUCU|nr:hypothetical protein NQ317_014016 [Molorchus minor]